MTSGDFGAVYLHAACTKNTFSSGFSPANVCTVLNRLSLLLSFKCLIMSTSPPQIIMAKPAGGPKAPQGKKDWDEDD